jgi:hypothetical protein
MGLVNPGMEEEDEIDLKNIGFIPAWESTRL